MLQRLALLAVLVGIVAWLGALGAVVAAASRDRARPAAAIIVMGAAQYDGRPSPSGSLTSSVLADEQALLDDDEDGDDGAHGDGSRLILGQERRRHVFRLVVFGTGTFG